jgi:hypothetical protein
MKISKTLNKFLHSKTLNKFLHSKYVLYGILLILIINIWGYLRIRKNKICEGARTIGKRTTPIRKLTTKRDISTRDINGRLYGTIYMGNNSFIESKLYNANADLVSATAELTNLTNLLVQCSGKKPKKGCPPDSDSIEKAISKAEDKVTTFTKIRDKLLQQNIPVAKLNKGIEVTSWKWGAEPNIHYYGKNRNKMYRMAEINNGDNVFKQLLMYHVPSSNFDSDKYSTNMFLNKLSLKKHGEILSI